MLSFLLLFIIFIVIIWYIAIKKYTTYRYNLMVLVTKCKVVLIKNNNLISNRLSLFNNKIEYVLAILNNVEAVIPLKFVYVINRVLNFINKIIVYIIEYMKQQK